MKHSRFLGIFLAVFVLVALLCITTPKAEAATVASGTCGARLSWTLDSNGTLTISGTGEMYDYNNLDTYTPWWSKRDSIKSVVIGEGITNIGEFAFANCTNITSAVIPQTVTSIETSAFKYCVSLRSVEIPAKVRSLGAGAFSECTGLEYLYYGPEYMFSYQNGGNLSGSFNHIGAETENGTNVIIGSTVQTLPAHLLDKESRSFGDRARLGSVTFEDGSVCTKISAYAFRGCSIREMCIPDHITIIDISAFEATGITDLKMGTGIKTICENAFESASISYLHINDVATWCEIDFQSNPLWEMSNYNYLYINGVQTSTVEIPEGVTRISKDAFSGYGPISAFSIPKTVMKIEESAFSCATAWILNYNATPTDLHVKAFENFGLARKNVRVTFGADVKKHLPRMNYTDAYIVDANNPWYASDAQGILYNREMTQVIYAPTNLSSAVVLPQSVTTISNSAFSDCVEMTSIVLPADCVEVGGYAFENCKGLQSITIPDKVTQIGNRAFSRCTNVTEITLGKGITTMGEGVFNYCYLVKKIVYQSVSLADYDQSTMPFVDAGSISRCVEVRIGAQVERIPAYLFYKAGYVTKVEFEKRSVLKEVGDYAFGNLSHLQEIKFTSAAPIFGANSFQSVTATAYYPGWHESWTAEVRQNYGGTITWVAYGVISRGECGVDGANLEWVISEDGVLRIFGNGSMANYTEGSAPWYEYRNLIKTVEIVDGVSTIGHFAFYQCAAMEDVAIGNNVASIGAASFKECAVLVSAMIPQTVNTIGGYAFYGCSALTSITIPCGVTVLEEYVFYNCASLQSVSILSNVTQIGEYAFYGCAELTSVAFTDDLTDVGERAFQGCSGLSAVYITDIAAWCNVRFHSLYSNPLYYAHNLYLNSELVINLVIPYGVDKVSQYAFSGCTSMTSVTIPDSVTGIGYCAFGGCSSLKSMVIPFVGGCIKTKADSYQYPFGYIFGELSYAGCTATTQYYITSRTANVTTIESSKYYIPTNLKTVVVAGGSVLRGAFYGCWQLNSVTLPEGITEIGDDAFYECTGLTSVNLPGGVTRIGQYAFYGCSGLNSVSLSDSLTKIEKYTFSKCTGLTTVIVPEGVATIEEGAFAECSGLASVTFKRGLTSIGKEAFKKCTGLSAVYITDLSGWCGVDFYDPFSNPLYYAGILYVNGEKVTDLIIPEEVSRIGRYAFAGCTGLKSVVIPDSVTNIGLGVFGKCTSLESLTIPFVGECIKTALDTYQYPFGYIFGVIGDAKNSYYAYQNYYGESTTQATQSCYLIPQSLKSVTVTGGDILSGAFYGCYELVSITISENTTSIGESAFFGCSGLKNFVVPDKVISIGLGAFGRCSSLEAITVPFIGDSIKTESDTYQYPFGYIFGTNTFNGCEHVQQIYYGSSTIQTTRTTYYIPSSLKHVTVTGGNILYGAFYGCSMLTSISIPEGITSIGSYAFYGCSMLTSISIPETVTSIGSYAFYGCSMLTSISIPENITAIPAYAFAHCTALSSVEIPNSVTSIAMGAFQGCSGLVSITIPFIGDSIKTESDTYQYPFGYIFGTSPCNGCEQVFQCYYGSSTIQTGTSYYIPSGLKHVTVTGGNILYGAFYGCSMLTSISIPEGITSIGSYAFICDNLKAVNIPDSVTRIDERAFYGPRLDHVAYSGTKVQWNQISIAPDNSKLTGANYIHCEIQFSWVENCINSGWYCPVCEDFVTRDRLEDGSHTYVEGECTECECAENPVGGYVNGVFQGFDDLQTAVAVADVVRLFEDTQVALALSKDLYIDLNGFDLSGTIVTNGCKVYGMDSTTDSYSCDSIGYFNCVDENGNAIVPVTHFKSDIAGSAKRYMTIKDENGYSFHRFYLGITHMNLRPGTTGVGYKAVFYGDEMVAANLDSFGFTMTLGDCAPKTAMKAAGSFISGKSVTLRIDNYDVEKYGETDLSAFVVLKLADGTVIESTAVTMTFRGLMEQLDTNYTALSAEQLNAVAEMIKKYAIIISWDLKNLFAL